MNSYYVKQLNPSEYYLVCMDYNSILNYIDELEKEPFLLSQRGTLIIDQLLVAGDGKNRFISCQFSFGKINLSSAKNLEGRLEYKKITFEFLQSHFSSLKYSILTENQLGMILEGQLV
jgi:hypothetical protein